MPGGSEYILRAWRLFRSVDARLLCVVLIALGVLYVEPTLAFKAHPIMGDDWAYWHMSNDLSDAEAPFSARILIPAIVHMLPINHVHAFFIITMSTLMMMLWVFFNYLKALEFSHLESLIGVVLLGAAPVLLYTERVYNTPEAAFFLLFVTAFYAIAAKKDWLFILALAVGVFTKETMLFVIPMYWFMVWRAKELFPKRRYLIATVLIGVLYIWFKVSFVHGASYISWGLVKGVWHADMAYNSLGYMAIPVATYLAMGLLWLPGLAAVHRTENPFLRRSLVITPFLLSQLFLAVDVTRMTFLLFPIMVPMALTAFRDRKFLPALLLWSVLVQVITYYRFEEDLWFWFEVNFVLAYNKLFIGIVALVLFWGVYSRWYAANAHKAAKPGQGARAHALSWATLREAFGLTRR